MNLTVRELYALWCASHSRDVPYTFAKDVASARDKIEEAMNAALDAMAAGGQR